MIRYTEYGWLADKTTENIDIYAYFKDEIAWTENTEVISVACIYEAHSYKVEITNSNSEVVYTTYLENGFEVNNLINLLDAVLGVTTRYNNIDD